MKDNSLDGHRGKVALSDTSPTTNSTGGGVKCEIKCEIKSPQEGTTAATNFDDDYNEWELGIGDLIIDLDADIEKTNTQAPSHHHHHHHHHNHSHNQQQQQQNGSSPESPTGSTAAAFHFLGSSAMSKSPRVASGSSPASNGASFEHQATVDKGLKMKIKRKTVGTKYSEAKHEIVQSDTKSSPSQENSTPPTNCSNAETPKPPKHSSSKGRNGGHRDKKNRDKRSEVNGVMSPLKITNSPAPPPLCSSSSPATSNVPSPAVAHSPQEATQASTSPPMPNLTLKLASSPQPIKQEEVPPSPPLKKIKLEIPEKTGEEGENPSSPIPPEMKDTSTCTSVGTITEPDCLGPCEPGTSVMLEGIVWQETDGGVLVVNVTWRGKTYVGTLLDCTKHDWAPPRFCESPTSDVDSKASKGRGKRGRGGNGSSSEANAFADARHCVQSKLRNGKGRRTAVNSFTVPNSPAKSDGGSNSSNGKRTSKASTPKPAESESTDSKKRSRSQARSTPTSTPGTDIPQPSSPVLIMCPEPNCSKKYKHINGLRYHQTHAHSGSDGKTDAEDSKDVTNSSDNEESLASSPAPSFAKTLLTEETPFAAATAAAADLSTLASVAVDKEPEPPEAATAPPSPPPTAVTASVIQPPCSAATEPAVTVSIPTSHVVFGSSSATATTTASNPPSPFEAKSSDSKYKPKSPRPVVPQLITPTTLKPKVLSGETLEGLKKVNKHKTKPVPKKSETVELTPYPALDAEPLASSIVVKEPATMDLPPDDSINENIQSPAYSDISDANDTAPVLESEVSGPKEKEAADKSGKNAPDTAPSPAANMTAYGMYPYYSQPPYLLPSVSPDKAADATKKPSDPKDPGRPWSAEPRHVEQPESKKPSREESSQQPNAPSPAAAASSSATPSSQQQQQQEYPLQQPYPYPYGYMQGYPYAIEPTYHMHLLESDPHYKQQYKQYVEDHERLYKQQQMQQQQHQQQQQQHQQQQHQQQQHHQQQQQQHHHSQQPPPSSHHQPKPSLHSVKEERSRENKEKPMEHKMVKEPPVEDIRPPSSLKEKQNENHQILKENIELKSQMDDAKTKINQFEMAMLIERQREDLRQDMRRYYIYQDREQQKQDHHPHHHQAIQHAHLYKHKEESHSKSSSHYGEGTRSSPAKADHSSKQQQSSSSPKGGIPLVKKEVTTKEEKPKQPKAEPKPEPEGQKPTMETTGPPPPPTNSYAYLHPSYLQPPHFPHMPFEPAVYRSPGLNHPMIVSTAHYGGSPYVHPQIRYELPPDAPKAPKALDLLHQVSQQYTTTHKIHELQEHALMSPTSSAAPSSTPTTTTTTASAAATTTKEPASKAVELTGSREASRSPPTQRHLHTHHHTHVGVGYPIYDPYGTIIASGPAPAVDCKPIHPLQVKSPAAGARYWQ